MGGPSLLPLILCRSRLPLLFPCRPPLSTFTIAKYWALLRNFPRISPTFHPFRTPTHPQFPPSASRSPPAPYSPRLATRLVLPNKYELCNLSIKYASSLNWSQGKSQFVNENNLFTDFLTFASLLLNRASRFTVVVLTFGGFTSNAILKEEADIFLRHRLRTRLYEFLS